MSNNLSKEGFDKVLIDLQKVNNPKASSIPPAQIQNDWARLASFMRGKN